MAIFLAAMLLFTVSCDGISEIPPEADWVVSFAPLSALLAKSPTRVLFMHDTAIHYYSILTGSARVFCFDPLCSHGSLHECIAQKFR